ncbi:hypothetical protein FQN49_002646 [Arthroderma sp. PD_2]|nr:hypothetical protein FQN49_002646 [Arthroderma sp. PD_2]
MALECAGFCMNISFIRPKIEVVQQHTFKPLHIRVAGLDGDDGFSPEQLAEISANALWKLKHTSLGTNLLLYRKCPPNTLLDGANTSTQTVLQPASFRLMNRNDERYPWRARNVKR